MEHEEVDVIQAFMANDNVVAPLDVRPTQQT